LESLHKSLPRTGLNSLGQTAQWEDSATQVMRFRTKWNTIRD